MKADGLKKSRALDVDAGADLKTILKEDGVYISGQRRANVDYVTLLIRLEREKLIILYAVTINGVDQLMKPL